MRFATPFRSLLATAAFALTLAVPALAQINAEFPTGNFGGINVTPDGVSLKAAPPRTDALTTIYDNTTSPAIYGVTSTDLASDWGDRLFTAGSGILSSQKFTIFNSPSSAGALLTATVAVDFYDAVTATYFGGYTTSINFGAGLNAGFFSVVTVTGISPLLINLATTDIVVIQSVLSKTGAANRLGVVSMDPPTVGASPTSMYVSSATIGGGVAGYYTFANGPANPGYQLISDVVVTPTRPTSWGKIKSLYK